MMTLFASRGDRGHPLSDLPLIVITPTSVEYDAEPGFTAEELEKDHLRLQADLTTLSKRGKQVFAKGSEHHVQLDDPAIAVAAIQEVVQRAKVPSEHRP